MERDEAIRLLTGGPDLIREWNERRERHEIIPDLRGAYLVGADLRAAYLGRADLRGADHFYGVNLGRTDLSGAYLVRANLVGANLSEANLNGVDLGNAYLRKAELVGANLGEANLREAYLHVANLVGAKLVGANLRGADLSETNLSGTNLRGADLSGTNLVGATMVRVDLRGAKLRDCHIHGISAWNIETNGDTEQVNLVISDDDAPVMTVDNLKVAQFIYLLLNNEEIREVIDTITSKVVLILGRFTSERKALLDAIRDELRRRYNYLPVMFDFDKPVSRNFTETITTLARMARFVIADLTDAAEVRAELIKIVPDLPSVPVQPLILASQTEYATFGEDIRRDHPWVLEPFRYRDPDHAIASLPEMVLAPAEAKVAEMRG
jgi:uncharacterized protein YjbI with pentapeptide repeats